MKNLRIDIDNNEIWKSSEKYFLKMCGFSEKNEEAWELRDRFSESLIPKIMVSVYPSDCIIDSGFEFEQIGIMCHGMGNVDSKNVRAVVLYAMCVEESADIEGLDMLERFYVDTWMTAILDGGRDWLKGYLQKQFEPENATKTYVTDPFGPGFYGMELEEIPALLKIIKAEEIGITLFHGTMRPPKSNIGFYLVMDEEPKMLVRDCKNCLADHKNCIFCKNYKA